MNLELFLKQFKSVKLTDNSMQVEPTVVKTVNNSEDPIFYLMNSRVVDYNHNECLEINKTMSKKLSESFNQIWCQIINQKHEESSNKFFNTEFIKFDNVLIDYLNKEILPDDFDISECINRIIDDLHINEYESKGGYNLNGDYIAILDNFEDSTSVIVITINLSKSFYSVHQGKYDTEGRIVLFNKPSILTYSFVEFVKSIDELPFSEQFELLFTLVKEIPNNMIVNLSIRELLDIIKKTKMDIIEDGLGIISDINNINIADDTLSIKEDIIESLSCYPYKTLKKMNWLRNSLKTSSISNMDILKLLSDNILNEYLAVSPFVLTDLYSLAFESDNMIVNSLIK